MPKGEATVKITVVDRLTSVQHDGYFVSSKDIPNHTEEMGIWIPFRVLRKWRLKLQEVREQAQLKLGEKGYLSPSAADKALVEILKQIPLHWNWKDEAGERLPQPDKDPDVWDLLIDREEAFIVETLVGAVAIPPQKSTA